MVQAVQPEKTSQGDSNDQIVSKLDWLRENTNFYSKQVYIRDQLIVDMFVNYEKVDPQGNPLLQKSEQLQPDAVQSVEEEVKIEQNADSSDVTDADSEEGF